MGLIWRGDALKSRMHRAAEGAINETNAAAAKEAADLWPRATGLSAESITVIDRARTRGTETVGSWGAPPLPSGEYDDSSRMRVLFNEIGVEGRTGLHFLRRSGDAQNRELAGRIRRRFP